MGLHGGEASSGASLALGPAGAQLSLTKPLHLESQLNLFKDSHLANYSFPAESHNNTWHILAQIDL